jgi:hypothetical protein
MGSLTYKKLARKGVDHTNEGVVYVHHFGTGFQELVFTDHASAERFAKAHDLEFRGGRDEAQAR